MKQRTISLPDQQLLLDSFRYDDGKLYWKHSPNNRIKVGSLAGSPDDKGYIGVRFQGKRYKATRLIWKMHYGVDPEYEIDHINHIKDDNRIENLQDITMEENERRKAISVANGGIQRDKNGYTVLGNALRRQRRRV